MSRDGTTEGEIKRLRGTLERIEKFIDAVAPTKRSKEMASIQNEVRAALGRETFTTDQALNGVAP